MAQTIIGIDIGSHSVKLALLTRSLREYELLKFYEEEIVVEARSTYEEAVATTIRSIIENHEITADVYALSLPAQHLSCRVVELPFTNIKKIEQTLEYELEGHIPVDIEDLLVDYHILSVEENRSTVLAAYLPRERFVKYLNMLEMAGIDPKYVGVDAIDLSNIAQVSMVPQDSVYAIIDVGHQKTNICVMEGIKLRYVRSVTLGGMHFTRAIQKAFKLVPEKAEALKIDRVNITPYGEKLDQMSLLCQTVAHDLVSYIRQTQMAFKQLYPEHDWTGVYLTGGGSRLGGLKEYMGASLKLNIHDLDALELVPHKLERTEGVTEIIAPALSQTLRVIFSNRAIKINFRRGEFAYKRDIQALGGEIKQLGFWLVLVFVLGLAYFFFSYQTLSARVDKAEDALVQAAITALPELKSQKNKSVKQVLTSLQGKTAELQSQLDALKSGSGPLTPLGLLLEVSKKLPSKEEVTVDIDDFSYTGDFLRLEGRTGSFEAVDKIKEALATSPYFKKVDAQNVAKGIKDEIKFTLSLEIEGATTTPPSS